MTIRFIRNQLRKTMNFIGDEPIDMERKAQDFVGAVMRKTRGARTRFLPVEFPNFRAAEAVPPELEGAGTVLYLHGGGYCCGDLEYAEGFASVLAAQAGAIVFCPAYRLAPEHPFPAAVDDAEAAYRYMLERCDPDKIVFAGESAGGGLIYSLCLRAKRNGLPLPGGLIAISPWTDLTFSGVSYQENAEADPSMTETRLRMFASMYTREPENPMVSPLFGDLCGLPESLLFVGGDEIMRSDAQLLHEKLLACRCESTLTIAPGLWHGYVLYGLKERRADMDAICVFIRRIAK